MPELRTGIRRGHSVTLTRQQRRAAERAAEAPATPEAQVGLFRPDGPDGVVVPDNRAGRRYIARTGVRAEPESGAGEEPQATSSRSGLGSLRSFASTPPGRAVKSPEVKDLKETKRRTLRLTKLTMKLGLQKLSKLAAFGKCGAVKTFAAPGHHAMPTASVQRTAKGNRASISNVLTCGSVWVCPTCAPKIAYHRFRQVRTIMKKAEESNFTVAVSTFTMRHKADDELLSCWEALALAWRLATGGGGWQKDKKDFGLFGWLRVYEVTKGRHGWHVHVHALLVFDRRVTLTTARHVSERMWERWLGGLEQKGFDAIRDRPNRQTGKREAVGLDVRLATPDPDSQDVLSQYFTKLAFEITGGHAKLANGEGLSPFQIAEQALIEEEFTPNKRRWRNLWAVWETGSRKRKQMGMSKSLREWANLPDDKDEDIPPLFDEEGNQLDDQASICLRWDTYDHLRFSPKLHTEFLEAMEVGWVEGGIAWLEAHDFYWSWPPPPPKVTKNDKDAA